MASFHFRCLVFKGMYIHWDFAGFYLAEEELLIIVVIDDRLLSQKSSGDMAEIVFSFTTITCVLAHGLWEFSLPFYIADCCTRSGVYPNPGSECYLRLLESGLFN